jgi:hypothetical protein
MLCSRDSQKESLEPIRHKDEQISKVDERARDIDVDPEYASDDEAVKVRRARSRSYVNDLMRFPPLNRKPSRTASARR